MSGAVSVGKKAVGGFKDVIGSGKDGGQGAAATALAGVAPGATDPSVANLQRKDPVRFAGAAGGVSDDEDGSPVLGQTKKRSASRELLG